MTDNEHDANHRSCQNDLSSEQKGFQSRMCGRVNATKAKRWLEMVGGKREVAHAGLWGDHRRYPRAAPLASSRGPASRSVSFGAALRVMLKEAEGFFEAGYARGYINFSLLPWSRTVFYDLSTSPMPRMQDSHLNESKMSSNLKDSTADPSHYYATTRSKRPQSFL